MKKPLGKEINELARDIRKFLSCHLDRYSLGDGQFGILYELLHNEGISQDELRRRRNVDKATIAKAVKRLIDHGYLYKERDTQDKRAFCLYTTPKGRELKPEIERIIGMEQELLLRGSTPEEMEVFRRVMRRMTRNIEEYFEDGRTS